MKSMYLFVFLTDLKVKLIESFSSAEGNCSSRGAIFLSQCKSMGEFSFLIINNKKNYKSDQSEKDYSITLDIRAHLSGEFGGCALKPLESSVL